MLNGGIKSLNTVDKQDCKSYKEHALKYWHFNRDRNFLKLFCYVLYWEFAAITQPPTSSTSTSTTTMRPTTTLADLDQRCRLNTDCRDEFAICVLGFCKCTSDYYIKNNRCGKHSTEFFSKTGTFSPSHHVFIMQWAYWNCDKTSMPFLVSPSIIISDCHDRLVKTMHCQFTSAKCQVHVVNLSFEELALSLKWKCHIAYKI